MSEAVDFQQVDLRFASDHEYECISTFNNILNHEYFPDDPPVPLEELVQDWKNIPALIEHQEYLRVDNLTPPECLGVLAGTVRPTHVEEQYQEHQQTDALHETPGRQGLTDAF